MGDAPFDVIFAVRRGGGATGMPMKSTIFREAATKEKKKKKTTTTGRIHPSGVIRLPIPPAFASNPLKRSRDSEFSRSSLPTDSSTNRVERRFAGEEFSSWRTCDVRILVEA
uniref:Uncharacterized protein n=1 Tax=Vespula pensylvanica TaxID=30213 RepID=A0A834UHF1_VESPE|nr:hypothetical protein H0235_001821 [Vespula pensylvanica]